MILHKHIPFVTRFRASYEVKENGCWLWIRTKDGRGYGSIKWEGKRIAAHRASWEIHVGPIPKWALVCHTCDVPTCVNPDHLWLGTPNDNMVDMIKKGRGKSYKFPTRTSKLTADDVAFIKSGSASKEFCAKKYGLSERYIRRIRNGERNPNPAK